jgi:hypothetical protein
MGPWDVNPNWMGVFMDKDSLVLSLWEAGVPVWHIRKIESLSKDLCIGKRVSMKWDPDIETHHDPASPHTTIHTGFGGEARAYLCWLIGNLALGNYVPLLSSESWDTWAKCAAPPNGNSLMATETFLPSFPASASAIVAGPSSLAHPYPVPSSSSVVVQRPPSPIVFGSRRQLDLKALIPELVEEISARVVGEVGKTLAHSVTTQHARGQERCTQLKLLTYCRVHPTDQFLKDSSRPSASRPTEQHPSWNDPKSAFLTPVVDVWATALASVDCAVNPRGNLLHSGVPFPDLFQLIRVEGGDQFARYIANWLMIMQAWVRALDAGRVGYPPHQLWWEILNGLPQFITRTN